MRIRDGLLYLAVCCMDTAQAGPVDRARRIVTLPFPDPAGAIPTDFQVLDNGEGADGIEFNATGSLYVASNFGDKVIVIDPDGMAVRTITNADLSEPATMDFPASLMFHDASWSLVITNYAFSDAAPGDRQRYVLTAYVDVIRADVVRPVVP